MTEAVAGTEAKDIEAGDILLTGIKAQGIISLAIKFGAWLRRYPKDARRFSHAALIVSSNGDLVEAHSDGVKRNHISAYKPVDYAVIHMNVDDWDKYQVLDYADSVLAHRESYGFVTFAGLALYCLLGTRLCLMWAGTAICSGFVCDALTRAGLIWSRPPFSMMPADIWRDLCD